MPRAAVDIGSNTILLLVVADDGAILHDEARVVGLGRGLGDKGLFRPDRMDAACVALRDYAERAASLGVPPYEIRCAATSGARRALNARAFIDRVHAESGIRVQVVSGEEEAQLTWQGALGGLRLPDGPVGVVDLGGGSTEMVMGDGYQVGRRASLEMGSVRLTEMFFGEDILRYRPADLARLKQHVHGLLTTFEWPMLPRAIVAVAGTATTLGAMERGLTTWDRAQVHGMKLSRASLRRWIDRLLDASPEERRTLAAVSPERADYLLAGACVLEAVCTHGQRDSLRISDGGVRHGLVHESARYSYA